MLMNYSIRISKILGRMVLLLILLSILTFSLVSLSPIDPVHAYLQGDMTVSNEHRQAIEEKWGLNDPPIKRYINWAGNMLKGDMGTSLTLHKPVNNVIQERFKLSFSLMLTAWILSGLNGFLLGILAAWQRGKVLDKLIKAYCLLIASSPTFWLGMIMVIIFAVKLQLFPIGMAVPMGKLASEVTLADRLYHLILPALTLSLTGVSRVALHTRQKLIESLESEYALFAFARGKNKAEFILEHGLRNIITPAITIHFMSIGELFGGSVLAETVFSYPGLGSAAVSSGLAGDLPLLMGIVMCGALFVFFGNLTANILYPVIDPRLIEEGYHAI